MLTLETSVDGYVGLDAGKKGINMSRIMRTFYDFKDDIFHPGKLEELLKAYKEDLRSQTAFLKLSFSYPMMKQSLRSGLEGYQYYDVSFEGKLDEYGDSANLCISILYTAAHARAHLNSPSTPGKSAMWRQFRTASEVWHRSQLNLNDDIFVDQLVELSRDALQTETQVMVKREDEQAFAEMNGAYQKFVEDAARLLYDQLNEDEADQRFRGRCAHLESLHSHDAVSRIVKAFQME